MAAVTSLMCDYGGPRGPKMAAEAKMATPLPGSNFLGVRRYAFGCAGRLGPPLNPNRSRDSNLQPRGGVEGFTKQTPKCLLTSVCKLTYGIRLRDARSLVLFVFLSRTGEEKLYHSSPVLLIYIS